MNVSNINIGIDLVNTKRKQFNSKSFAKKICTESEYNCYLSLENRKLKTKYLASLWAIKEATLKATNKFYNIRKIEVIKTENARIVIVDKHILKVSISYQDKYVIATVLSWEKDKYENR